MCLRLLCSMFFSLFTILLSAQSITQELKNDLWRTIKPEEKKDSFVVDSVKKLDVQFPRKSTFDIPHFLRQSRAGLSLDEAYKLQQMKNLTIDPQVYTFDAAKLKEKEYSHILSTSQFNGLIQSFSRGNGGFVLIINISGGGQEKLSKKTKWILKNVYNVNDDEFEGK